MSTQGADNLSSVDRLEMVVGFSEGPCLGLWNQSNGLMSVMLDDTPIENSGGGTNLSTYGQPSVGAFEIVFSNGAIPGVQFRPNIAFGSPVNVNQALLSLIPVIRQGSQVNVDSIYVRLLVSQMGYASKAGTVNDYQANINITVGPASVGTGQFWNPLGAGDYPDWLQAALVTDQPTLTNDGYDTTAPTPASITVNTASTYRDIYVQATQPANIVNNVYTGYQGYPMGPIWFDSTPGHHYKPYLYDGTNWNPANATFSGFLPSGATDQTTFQSIANIACWTITEDDGVVSYAYVANPPNVPPVQGDATHMWIIPGEQTTAQTTQAYASAWLYNGVAWVTSLVWDEPPTTVPSGNFFLTGHTSTPYVKELIIPVPRITQPYVVSVTKLTGDNDAQSTCDISFDSFTEVRNDPLQFDGLMCGHFTFRGSSQFSSQAKLTIDAGGVLVPIPNGYDPIAKTYPDVWDGTWVYGFTDNPAFHVKNFIENSRYGLAHYTPAKVDPFDIYAFAQFCDRYTFTFNEIISQQQPIRDLINNIAGLAGGTWVDYGNGMSQVLYDDWDATPVMAFGPENVVGGTFQYSFTAIESRKNDVTVTYTEPQYKWQSVPYRLDGVTTDPDHISRYGSNPEKFVAIGCIFQAEAVRRAMLRMLKSTREKAAVTFKTNRIALGLQPFEQILICDSTVGNGISGRIRRQIGSHRVMLRDPVTLPAAHNVSYVCRLMSDTETQWQANVITQSTTASGVYQSLTFDQPLPDALPDNSFFTIENAISGIGMPKTFKVLSVEVVNGDQDNITVSALEIDKTIGAQLLSMTVDESIYSLPSSSRIGIVHQLTANPSFAADGSITVKLTWQASPTVQVSGYKVEMVSDGGVKQLLATVTASNLGYSVTNAGRHAFTFFVTALTVAGNSSYPAGVYCDTSGTYAPSSPAVANLTVVDTTDGYLPTWLALNPQANESLWQEFKGQAPTLSWAASTAANLDHYDVDVVDYIAGTVLDTYHVPATANPTWTYAYGLNQSDHGGTAARIWQANVYGVTSDGTRSPRATVIACNPPPPIPTATVTRYGTDLRISYPLPSSTSGAVLPADANFAAAQVFVSSTSGFSPGSGTLVYQGNNAIGVLGAAGTDATLVGLENTVTLANRYPSVGYGNNNDILVCTDDSGLYQKSGSTQLWTKLATLTAATATLGTTTLYGLATTPAGKVYWSNASFEDPMFNNGDVLFATSTATLYLRVSGAWSARSAAAVPPSSSSLPSGQTLWASTSNLYGALQPTFVVVGLIDTFGDGAVSYSTQVSGP